MATWKTSQVRFFFFKKKRKKKIIASVMEKGALTRSRPVERTIAGVNFRRPTVGRLDVVRNVVLSYHLLSRRSESDALLEVGEDIIPSPFGRERFLVLFAGGPDPRVVVLGRAAHEEHAVHGGAATDDGAGEERRGGATKSRLWHRSEVVEARGAGIFVARTVHEVGAYNGFDGVGHVEIAIFDDEDRIYTRHELSRKRAGSRG